MKRQSNWKELLLPLFYKAANASSYAYGRNVIAAQSEAHAWRAAHGLSAAVTDSFNPHPCLIDVQKNFCAPEDSRYVVGRSGRSAIDDSTDFRKVFREMGIEDKWFLPSGQSAQAIHKDSRSSARAPPVSAALPSASSDIAHRILIGRTTCSRLPHTLRCRQSRSSSSDTAFRRTITTCSLL